MKEKTNLAFVWVKFPNFPIKLSHEEAFKSNGINLGRFIAKNTSMENICVELDLGYGLPNETYIEAMPWNLDKLYYM